MIFLNSIVNVTVTIVPPAYNYSEIINMEGYKIPERYSYVTKSTWLTDKFLIDNNMPGELSVKVEYYEYHVKFVEHLPIDICEDVYRTLSFFRPPGVLLTTNRTDLFAKEREYLKQYEKLQTKKAKLEHKLEKVNSAISILVKEGN